jgi:hypothetical protein
MTVINKLFFLSVLGILSIVSWGCQSRSLSENPTPTFTPSTSTPVPQVSVTPSASQQPSAPAPTPAVSMAVTPQPNPVFRPIFPALKYQTKIPILLPKTIPGTTAQQPFFAILESATAAQYKILLAWSENCNGGNACRLGTVSGMILPAQSSLEGKPVTLSKGITGYFIESTCGANCSDATLTWDLNGYRYSVGIKAGDKAPLLEMANSAISNGAF